MHLLDRLHAWAISQPALRLLTLITRVLLALAFVPSGLVKILGQPFTLLPVTDPVGYFFAGFFSATGFYRFVGVSQWVAAACLLMPRTATLGAFLYVPIVLNIFVITVAIGPAFAFTRVITGGMLLGSVWLLFWDWDRWKQILPNTGARDRRHGDLLTVLGLLAAGAAGLQGLIGLNMSRVRGTSYATPLLTVAIATVIGGYVLVRAYRMGRTAA